MAEGWAKKLHPNLLDACSAGTKPKTIDPRAVQVMEEEGVDISNQYSKSLDELDDCKFDLVVTVCDNARETCPCFPCDAKVIHHSFEDPPHLAAGITDEEKALDIYRRVRDQIRSFVSSVPSYIDEV
ncbi:MAG: arsenate reductase ArsC [Planctomycetota bacterium]|nr:arsenate reductase ArsC [Planctomycetota bacterium]